MLLMISLYIIIEVVKNVMIHGEKGMFQDVDVKVQVRFVPVLGRRPLNICLLPMDRHKCFHFSIQRSNSET